MSRNDRGCAVHNGAIHGGEAEELRSGIEALIKHDLHVTSSDLQSLLDRVDARDSLAYLEHADEVTQRQKHLAELNGAEPRSANTLPKDLVSHESSTTAAHHGLDTDETVCFYEQEFYPLSNFSAFTLEWKGYRFDTSEAAYHWEKFTGPDNGFARFAIRTAPSAHAAFQIARSFKESKRADWDDVKINVMRTILRAKVAQHPYVRKKLLETGVRRLVDGNQIRGPSRDSGATSLATHVQLSCNPLKGAGRAESAAKTGRLQEDSSKTEPLMNNRGQYGQSVFGQPVALVGASPSAPRLDYSDAGLALGIGTILGILIGSRLTFHSPVRRRRSS